MASISSNQNNPHLRAIVRKNFSLLLALRYLNPLRTHVSVITLISLAGVAIGVMVLIVVLSVFGGFEQLVKNSVLSYTPHIIVERAAPWPDADEFPDYNAEKEWRALEKSMQSLGSVDSAFALVNDFVLLDRAGAVAPAYLQAIDTTNTQQVQSLQSLIKEGNGTADMGLGGNAVISSITARNFNISVHDIIQVHTIRNLEQIRPVFDRLDNEPLFKSHTEELQRIKTDMLRITVASGQRETIPASELKYLYYNQLTPLLDLNICSAEKEIIGSVLDHIKEGTPSKPNLDDGQGFYTFPAGHMKASIALLDRLKKINITQENANDLQNIQSLVLPIDLTVTGIYQTTPHAKGPDIFVPLPVGQDLLGLGDKVKGIALRLKDPYLAAKVLANEVANKLPNNGDWVPKTWMQDHQQQFGLIKAQRQLLTFSLSFIMMVSAFSIMAVMFTVTIQKKREIGVMKALGATPSQLIRVFLYQGVIIGLFGGLLGLGLGYLVIKNRNHLLDLLASLGFDPFSAEFNGFEGLPAIMRPDEFIGVFIFAFVMCVLATYVPALIASRSDAAKSLRNM